MPPRLSIEELIFPLTKDSDEMKNEMSLNNSKEAWIKRVRYGILNKYYCPVNLTVLYILLGTLLQYKSGVLCLGKRRINDKMEGEEEDNDDDEEGFDTKDADQIENAMIK